MNNGKLKKVEVDTIDGLKKLTFRSIKTEADATGEVACDGLCPYSKVCDKLPDPRKENSGKPEYTFCDFCSELGDSDEELDPYIPVEGTLEENLFGIKDINQILIDANPIFKLDQIIDNVCPGWCDSYSADHQYCKSTNKMCIMNKLLEKKESKKNE